MVRCFSGLVSFREVPGRVVFLEGLAFAGVDDFGDLLQDVADIFGGVFVPVGLGGDLSGAVVFGFCDRAVGLFDFDRLVIRVVGVCRFVTVRVGDGFDVAVGVVGVFGGVAERVGDLQRPALFIEFDFRGVLGRFGAFDVALRAGDRGDLGVFVVFPRALVGFCVCFSGAVSGVVVRVFPGVFDRVGYAREVPVRVVGVFGGLGFAAGCGPFDRFWVAVAVAFDRRRLPPGVVIVFTSCVPSYVHFVSCLSGSIMLVRSPALSYPYSVVYPSPLVIVSGSPAALYV